MERSLVEDVAAVSRFVEAADFEGLERYLEPLHSADIADIIEKLEPSQQIAVLKRLDRERAAEALTEVDQRSGQALLFLLSDGDVVSLLSEMQSDDAADILSALPREKTERIEALLPAEDREQLKELMGFGEDTAGGIMEVEYLSVVDSTSIRDTIELVRSSADEIENIQKIYVVKENGELIGRVGLLDLLLNPRSTPVGDVMEENPLVVPVDMDQEEVAGLFGKYDEFTLPVVDANRILVGRITVDDIIDVIEEEATEDIVHIAGTTEEEMGETSPVRISRARLPWLITGLLGQVVAAVVMSRYEVSLRVYVVLAFFVPLIVGTAGSVGIQAAVVVVRELALGQVDKTHIGRRVLRELAVALISGVVLGSILFALVFAWQREIGLAVLLISSLLIVISVAALIGTAVPLVLERCRIDPAIATGPFIAVSNDIIGLIIYLSLANVYLSHFH